MLVGLGTALGRRTWAQAGSELSRGQIYTQAVKASNTQGGVLFEFIINTQNIWNTYTIGWACTHAYANYNRSTPSLSAVALQKNFTFSKQKWVIEDKDRDEQILSLMEKGKDTISIRCWLENSMECATASRFTIEYAESKLKHKFNHIHACPMDMNVGILLPCFSQSSSHVSGQISKSIPAWHSSLRLKIKICTNSASCWANTSHLQHRPLHN